MYLRKLLLDMQLRVLDEQMSFIIQDIIMYFIVVPNYTSQNNWVTELCSVLGIFWVNTAFAKNES